MKQSLLHQTMQLAVISPKPGLLLQDRVRRCTRSLPGHRPIHQQPLAIRVSASSRKQSEEYIDSSAALHKQLGKQMKTMETVDALLRFIAANKEQFNFRNAVTAFHRLSTIAKKQRYETFDCDNEAITSLVELLLQHQEPWNLTSIALVLSAHSSLNHGSKELISSLVNQHLTAAIDHQLTDLRSVITLAYALAKLNLQNKSFTDALNRSLERPDGSLLPALYNRDCGLVDVTTLAWSLSHIDTTSPAIVSVVEIALDKLHYTKTASPQIVTMLAAAASKTSVLQKEILINLVDQLAAVIVNQHQLNARDSASVLNAYTQLVQRIVQGVFSKGQVSPHHTRWQKVMQHFFQQKAPRWAAVDTLLNNCIQTIPRMNPEALMVTTWSCAVLQEPREAVLSSITLRANELAPAMNMKALANLCWSFASMRWDDEDLLETLASAAYSRLTSSRTETVSSQAIAMMIYSLSILNRCNGPSAQALIPLLVDIAEPILDEFSYQGLCNMAWGLTVAKIYPPTFLQRWRARVAAGAQRLSPQELAQLHQIEVALRLEAPEVVSTGSSSTQIVDYTEFFDAVYQLGRAKAAASREWTSMNQAISNRRSISSYQQQVHTTVCELDIHCELEYFEPVYEYSIDVALPRHKIAIEADGPTHYAVNNRRLLGATALKRRLLDHLGWRVVDVPYYEWNQCSDKSQQLEYMEQKLTDIGIDLTIEQQQPEEPRTIQIFAEDLPVEKKDGSDIVQVDDEDVEQVVDRAKQIDLLKLRSGTLSKEGLLSKALKRKKLR